MNTAAGHSLAKCRALIAGLELPVQKLQLPLFQPYDIDLELLRADKLRIAAPEASAICKLGGNKLFKLLPNMSYAQQCSKAGVLTFGGPWSNHLHAVANNAAQFGLQSAALVRGERAAELTPTLLEASRAGMDLYFVPRSIYRNCQRDEGAGLLRQLLGERFEELLLLPEGGTNALGIAGASLLGELTEPHLQDGQSLWLACGTGGTALGVALGLQGVVDARIQAVSVVANPNAWQEIVQLRSMLAQSAVLESCDLASEAALGRRLQIVDGSLGRYAAMPDDYLVFYQQLEEQLDATIDPVYMGKVFYALWQSLKRGELPHGSRVAVLHSGGQQGRRGLQQTKMNKTTMSLAE